jgi:hypothetical protein
MYGTISDNQGYYRSTSSQRGRVTSVNAWINSLFGTVLNASARYSEIPVPDLRRIPKDRRESVKDECAEQERVSINIEVEPNPHYILRLNGLNVPMVALENLNKWNMQKFELQIKQLERMRDNGQMAGMMKVAQQIMVR